ncbi:lysylphosphatidylglycerol synthase transmembrane domain-containing protein [Plebeiibacterium marinum]|uniref:Flippase-like domain-containing protein n=1 Tax=Plebeiibacterium marinum TaxID=2992111 RepID=A0AAE3SK64_9BACT|nr:lysylphosphatidylglycerol synthase transmembrane domain-containing protein [Plebeiobacterium marinum]MCW3806465.1 flippase-like domain-containing protein [Plebeiobacterium marinum]
MKFINKYSKALKLIAKIVLSAAALYYVFKKIDYRETLDAVMGIKVSYLILSILLYALSQVISSFRLYNFYKYVPVRIGSTANLKLYWLGMFYNMFLPGGVGGDGYKVFLLNKYRNTSVKKLIGTVFADRLSGLAVIVVYICALVYFIDYDLGKADVPEDGVKIVHDILLWINPFLKYFVVFIPVIAVGYYWYLKVFSSHLAPSTWKVFGLSLVIQGLQMLSAILILKSMGTELAGRQDDYLFLFFLSSIMSAIPISLGGLGLREMTFMYGSQYLGLNLDHAVALSIIFYLISLFISLFGGYYAYKPAVIFEKDSFEMEE